MWYQLARPAQQHTADPSITQYLTDAGAASPLLNCEEKIGRAHV